MSEKPSYKELELRVGELELQVEGIANELVRKNIALTEILEKYNDGKRGIEARVSSNVNRLILPALNKLIDKSVSLDKRYLIIIRQNIEDLTSSFSIKLSTLDVCLTPKEYEICLLVRGGFSIKEIATLQNISERTVESHRLNIRNKVGINSTKTSLATFLSDLPAPNPGY